MGQPTSVCLECLAKCLAIGRENIKHHGLKKFLTVTNGSVRFQVELERKAEAGPFVSNQMRWYAGVGFASTAREEEVDVTTAPRSTSRLSGSDRRKPYICHF